MNPLHLLKLEWKRYGRNGTFRVIGALYVGLFVLVLLMARGIGHNMTVTSNGTTSHPLTGLFAYPQNWKVLACMGSWMNVFLLGFLGVSMITMEFSNRTLRQSVIFGMTRMEVAVSKLVWAAALALGVTGFFVLLGFGGELVDGGMGLPLGGSVVGFFLQALGYLLLGTLAGLFIRQTALAVVAYLAYVFMLETIGRWIFYYCVAKTRLLLFLPVQALGALTPLPVPESVNHLIYSNASTRPLSPVEAAVTALVYIGIFALLFCRRIVKSDL
jgi:ABC-type transport system involved in multi-copper enzyme maturation permease subunit